MKRIATAALWLTAACLTACGGGGDGDSTPAFVTVKVAGKQVGTAPAGQSLNVSAPVGSSLEIDCTSSVGWTLIVGTNSLTGHGDTVNFDGVSIQETTTADSTTAWTANTMAAATLVAPVSFSVVAAPGASSTATVNVTVTN